MYSVIWAVIVVVMVASGVASIVSGSGPGPAMLVVPGFMTAFSVFAMAVLSWQTLSATERLLGELSEILGSTATME